MPFPFVGALCISCVLASSAVAAEGKTASVRSLIARALETNPALVAARARVHAEEGRPAALDGLPDPVLSWEAWNAPDSFAPNRADQNIFRIAQRLPYPGKLASLAGEAREAAGVAAQELAVRELDLATAVKRTHAELWAADERRRVRERDLDLARRLATRTERLLGVGRASQTDTLRAHGEAVRVASLLETDALEREVVVARLNALTGDPPDEPIARVEDPARPELPPSAGDLVRVALEHRPDVLVRRAEIRRAEAALDAARLGARPDFELAVSRFVNHDARDGFGAMASVTLPFAWRSKWDASAVLEERRLAAARAELGAAEATAANEVTAAFALARASARRVALAEANHLPQAERMLGVSVAAFETGTSGSSEWLESFREVERVHLEHLEAAAALATAIADLERAVGADLADVVPSAPPAGEEDVK